MRHDQFGLYLKATLFGSFHSPSHRPKDGFGAAGITCPYQILDSRVAVMQSTNHGLGNDGTKAHDKFG
jgi:hypothetical protein